MNKHRKNVRLSVRNRKNILFAPVVVLLGLILSFSFILVPTSSAQDNSPFLWQVQVMQSDQTGLANPVGLAFSSRANAFQVAEGKGPSETTDLVKLTPFADRAGEARIAAAMRNPINIA